MNWIKTKDRLPEVGQMVWVYAINDEGKYVIEANTYIPVKEWPYENVERPGAWQRTIEGYCCCCVDFDFNWDNDKVTHWMPFPFPEEPAPPEDLP